MRPLNVPVSGGSHRTQTGCRVIQVEIDFRGLEAKPLPLIVNWLPICPEVESKRWPEMILKRYRAVAVSPVELAELGERGRKNDEY